MKNVTMAVALTGALALTLTACGDDGGSGSGGDGALVGEGTGADCTIEEAIPVGAALSLTGAAASYGASQQKGLELAAEELNEVGGVTYDLTIEDDQTDARQGISVFETLTADSSIIIGPTLSNTAFQAQPVAQEASVPVMAISNTAAGITEQGNYIFRNALTEAQVIPQTVRAAVEAYDLESVVVMYSNDDAFTEDGYKVFAETLEEDGIDVAATLTFSKADTDFRALLTEAANAEPDAIMVSGLIEAAIPLVTQARELGLDVPIVGGNGFNNPQLMADAGEAAEGVVVGAAWNSASEGELNNAFKADFEEEYGHGPDQFAAQAHAAMHIIDEAVRANCSGERDDIQDGLGQINELDTVLGPITINSDRDAEHEAVVQVIQDGQFAVLD
ncbi:ABC transporter substrate-binding protein [Ornithinimicrobium pratense]|uniref:ABC transporter substrate-binding protein n=1 Tax=Ornithinimicrobium pratense TaxID=2593973 RepID=A0A5J6V445_9MICO|nr:ABC transporter substrate-binding protein [Ornithinimicrobium pratense]QFG68515.1 ABC transporter substrate-binding protein [Ornithinimicrobium pratense]